MLFFFFAPSADRISDQPGYATNLPAQLNPTDSERSKGLMHSLKFSTAQAGSLMQDLPLHCNYCGGEEFLLFLFFANVLAFAFQGGGGGGREVVGGNENKRERSFYPRMTSV